MYLSFTNMCISSFTQNLNVNTEKVLLDTVNSVVE